MLCVPPLHPKHHTPVLFPSLIPKLGALFWCLQPCPVSAYPWGCIRKLTANSCVPTTRPRPWVTLPVCQGQVTFEPHGIIKAAPNCLCLCISLTRPWIGSYGDVLSGPAHHTRLHLGTLLLGRNANQSSSAITNKPPLFAAPSVFLVSTNWVPLRPA